MIPVNALKLVKLATIFAAFAGISVAGVKYVAVVETDIDPASGAVSAMTAAEVRLITGELRREAVKNLPRTKYNVMTTETVMAQGSAVLEECTDENCVITLGSKIGADFIVRGTISKFQTLFTLTVDIYETNDGNLVASSDPVRSENIRGLLENAAPVCAGMYKEFANAQNLAPATPAAPPLPATYTVTAAVSPANGGAVSRNPNQAYYTSGTIVSITATPASGYEFTGWSGASASTNATLTGPIDRDLTLTANFYRKPELKPNHRPAAPLPPKPVREESQTYAAEKRSDGYETTPERRPMAGFSLGYGFSKSHNAIQPGFVCSIPISKNVASLNAEGNIQYGFTETCHIFAVNMPLTVLFQWSILSFEIGAHGDILWSDTDSFSGEEGVTLFNGGLAVGAGLGFSEKHSRRYFYRYYSGNKYGTNFIGMWWLF